jgi:hypothetical protein
MATSAAPDNISTVTVTSLLGAAEAFSNWVGGMPDAILVTAITAASPSKLKIFLYTLLMFCLSFVLMLVQRRQAPRAF